MNIKFNEVQTFHYDLIDRGFELLPSVTEVFELELATLEQHILSKDEFLERTAYFKSFNNEFSKHYLLYSQAYDTLNRNYSSNKQDYFKSGLFSTGYATHGLFPYKGKFHPQLIKALINILGVKRGEIILDPMCGSGTLNIEAALLGIDTFGVDVSPFCQLMTTTKFEALKIEKQQLLKLTNKPDDLFELFSNREFIQQLGSKYSSDELRVYQLILLAFLDAMGFAARVSKLGHRKLFAKVLKRYIDAVLLLITNPHFDKSKLGNVQVLKKSEALQIELEDNSVDCIITSPPYSFAIDYAENDKPQLEYLGFNTEILRDRMIGLKGHGKEERLNKYFDDLDTLCLEVSRVLKKGKYFVSIIGSNTHQTGGIRLDEQLIIFATRHKLSLVKSILKPIKGLRNSMKEEYILFFEKS